MQTVSSKIWTRVAVSISYDDNYCTMSASLNFLYVKMALGYSSFHVRTNPTNSGLCCLRIVFSGE